LTKESVCQEHQVKGIFKGEIQLMANHLTFGEWLRDQRKTAGMTQKSLAEHVGLTKLQVSRLESGLQKATVDRVRPLIEVLKTDPVEAASWLQQLEQ
jgi:transcriptional regulator with XRE-family HTH domain